MWKKNEAESKQTPAPAARPVPQQPTQSAALAADRDGRVAWIGPTISIAGSLVGAEDLMIEGQLEGEIRLEQHSVTVGKKGRLKADIHGKSIRIEGEVHGNLFGADDVVIRQTGRVEGNLTAPRVTLENGSRFRGSIDMDAAREPEKAAPAKPNQQGAPADGQRSAAARADGSASPSGSKTQEAPRAAKPN